MKKKILNLLLTTLSISALAACGGSSSSAKEITFWHCIGHDKMKNLTRIIDKFNADHAKTDGYYIAPEKLNGDYDSLHDAVKTKLQAGYVPSITMGYPDSFSEYIGNSGEANSKILKLDSYIDGDADFNKDDFVPEYYKEGTGYQYHGTWSVPLYKSTEAMYINKQMFEGTTFYKDHKNDTYGDYGAKISDPSTWDWKTLMYIATEVQQEKGKQADFHAVGYDSDSNLFISQMAMRKIPYTTAEGKGAEHFLFVDPTTGKINEGFKNMCAEIFALTQSGALATKGSYGSYSSDLFLSKKSMIAIGSTGGSAYNDPKGSTRSDFDCELYAVPAFGGKDNAKYIMQGPSLCFFNTGDEKKQAAAWEFYSKYVSDPTLNAELSLENSYDPVRQSSYKTESYNTWVAHGKTNTGEDDITAQLQYRIPSLTASLKDNYYATPVFNGSGEARTQVGEIIKYAQAEAKNLTPLEKVTNAIEKAYDKCMLYMRGVNEK